MRAFFEWGQTSIIQRLPKARGFTRHLNLVKEIAIINLGVLDQDKRISDTMEISKKVLKELWYLKHDTVAVKVLGDGDYTKHLKFVDVEFFSKSAKEKIDHPGATKIGKIKVKSIKEQKQEKEGIKKEKVKKVIKEEKVSEEKPVKKIVKKIEAKPLLEVEGEEIAKPKRGRPASASKPKKVSE